ncbi:MULTISPECIES: N-acetyltransferase [unclassified Chelatococcus]|uniref:GNAT family N-acetyltransferase n=1 Tax=unclassified Chelatococcus TaxID=2638111 RepID=UPI001BCCDE32|nr:MULTISPECIES: N-acetyltransferase [unclassified Chelatococcus]CAH1663681.1 putative N-acetyltransferase YhbS [Hyphomicrobiales bacterium]MBS7741607.1 N-acetyltransferase [Chelatococcus sp. HY11]MBX3544374.1 N-acetyltransferase [Chelatococcus sp.]MCO5079102.1 N-acetyltransferase [Chelatococcus sp.]CAH1682136.1 putative N-acetyltransferase YhbS [Hyphomicrobiales bacterium]
MIMIRDEIAADISAREVLLDKAFGPGRFMKTCERLREGRLPAEGLALSAVDEDGALVGTLRLWSITTTSGHDALLLGPLAVSAERQGSGLGSALMRDALMRAAAFGHGAVLLVGDEPYYRRFAFASARTATLSLPGPYERERFLACELRAGALDGASGLVLASGRQIVLPVEFEVARAA